MNSFEPRFVECTTQDGLALPGLLYEVPKSKMAAIYLHGNGSASVFYRQAKNRSLAEALKKKGISTLFFNNRGAELMKKLYVSRNGNSERKRFGMAYEKIKDCVKDIDGAIAFLKTQGYKTFFLMGESTGANKICVYNFYKSQNEIAKYILLAGGDDTGLNYDAYGKTTFWKLLKKAQEKIRAGKGEELAPETLAKGDPFSYQSFFDIANPDGDYNVFPYYEVLRKERLSKKKLFRHFTSIKKPTLVIYGAQDEYAWGDVLKVIEVLKSYQPTLDYGLIPETGHSFHGKEKELAKRIADWLSRN